MAATGSTTAGQLRRRRARTRLGSLRLVLGLAMTFVVVAAVGYVFAGSSGTIPPGTTIDGVDVGGLSVAHARDVLAGRAQSLQRVPVAFTAAGQTFRLTPYQLGVTADWRGAVAAAVDRGSGFGFVRGYKRLLLRFRPLHLFPSAQAYDAAVAYEVGVLAGKVDRPARDAALARHGLRIELVHGQAGTVLDQSAAKRVIVRALAGFGRTPVALPVKLDRPKVTARDLAPAQKLDERVLSAPVTLKLGSKAWQITRWQLAAMLLLQQTRHDPLTLGGPAANRYFAHLVDVAHRAPRDATFALDGAHVTVVPARTGIGIDVPRTVDGVLAAARRVVERTAPLVVSQLPPGRTTADAKAMGITGIVGSYETFFGGIPNRIHNVELVAHLVDDKLIAPGATFSFNDTTGARTAAKGFVAAPVIINGELQTALGGGVCQVSTTVFNAAYEAGLPITARTNHALYISHYPLGRDATVNYPDTDLRFVNDTKHWLLLRTFVSSSSLAVNLYGTPQGRRVVTTTAPLVAHGTIPVKKTVDPTLKPGEVVVDDPGMPAQTTSVHRLVYAPNGTLLYDNTWYSSYRASPKLIRVGPKPKISAPTTKSPQ